MKSRREFLANLLVDQILYLSILGFAVLVLFAIVIHPSLDFIKRSK